MFDTSRSFTNICVILVISDWIIDRTFKSRFLYSFLKGYDLEKSCQIGNWVASKAIQGFGMDKFPTVKELEEFYHENNQTANQYSACSADGRRHVHYGADFCRRCDMDL